MQQRDANRSANPYASAPAHMSIPSRPAIPPSVGRPQGRAPGNGEPVDVDRLIELIAERIDRSTLRPEPVGPPPRYPEHPA